MIKIACCQYEIEVLANWESYVAKIKKLISETKQAGANMVLMPEYAGLEIACEKFKTDAELFAALTPLIPNYLEFYQALAIKQQMIIQPGTIIERNSRGEWVNRAYLFLPDGSYDYQDKLELTEYEKHVSKLSRGTRQKVFNTPIGKLGIAICYDSEFPEIVRPLVQQGATVILAPSYTTSKAGFHRVYLSCRARAIENQCYVAISYVVNTVDVSGELEKTYGQAAIVGPADIGFPADGIINQGEVNRPMFIISELSLDALEHVRSKGEVHNYKDALGYRSIKSA